MKITGDGRGFVRDNLKGKILEMGAASTPFPIGTDTQVTYQDRLSTEQLKELYKDEKTVNIDEMVNVDIVSTGEIIPMPDETFDAVVSSHNFEHLANPLKFLFEALRVTKTGGYVYMIVPDKRETFDRKREVTPPEHIIKDYADGIKYCELEHFKDFCDNVDGHHSEQAQGFYDQQFQEGMLIGSIHIHTFTEDSLRQLLKGFNIVDFYRFGMNICCLIKKEAKK